ncbi:MAG: SAP domain-containing protein [Saccharofermentans sp.]|nr:SAP domain-containing protein [Saccharofermentans sp.]
MNDRPLLNKDLSGETFRKWYWLKEELVDFCRANEIPATGSKTEISDRISYYLDTGKVLSISKTKRVSAKVTSLSLDSIIEPDIVCSEVHRAFFKEQIGEKFSFNVAFQKWLKANAGRTYRDAVEAYYLILEETKKGRSAIDKQFEYNTYIRDFFEDNKGLTLDDAIKCWKYKKSSPGHNRYERSDLTVLKRNK